MTNHTIVSRAPSRLRRSWTIFGVVSTVAVGACLLAALRSGGASSAGVVLLGGLIVVGIAAALMHAIVSPFPDGPAARHSLGGSFDGGGGGGFGGDFGGGGGGDCGG